MYSDPRFSPSFNADQDPESRLPTPTGLLPRVSLHDPPVPSNGGSYIESAILNSKRFPPPNSHSSTGRTDDELYFTPLPPSLPFNLPSQPSPREFEPTTLQHRPSTKELINLYETTTVRRSNSHMPDKTSSPRTPKKSSSLSLDGPVPELPLWRRSPIRDSFRNLLSVFGKKSKKKGLVTTELEGTEAFNPPERDPTAPIIPTTLREGQLLYITPDANPPIWKSYDATLTPPYLVLNHTLHPHPPPRRIHLAECLEVHSVAANKIPPDVTPVINGIIAHVFELEFEDGRKEMFAVPSVRERGGWVSALWDALLASKQFTAPPLGIDASGSPFADGFPQHPLRVVNASNGSQVSVGSPRPPSTSSEEILGRRNGTTSPVAIPAPPPAPSPSDDVSIRTIDKLTAVQQKLAQLRRYSAPPSASLLKSPKASSSGFFTTAANSPNDVAERVERSQSSPYVRPAVAEPRSDLQPYPILSRVMHDPPKMAPIPPKAPPKDGVSSTATSSRVSIAQDVNRPYQPTSKQRLTDSSRSDLLRLPELASIGRGPPKQTPAPVNQSYQTTSMQPPEPSPSDLLRLPELSHAMHDRPKHTARSADPVSKDIEFLLNSIQAHVIKHADETNTLRDELGLLHKDFQGWGDHISLIVSSRPPETNGSGTDVDAKLESIRSKIDVIDIVQLKDVLERLQAHLDTSDGKRSPRSPGVDSAALFLKIEELHALHSRELDLSPLLKKLDATRSDGTELSVVLQKLDELQLQMKNRKELPSIPTATYAAKDSSSEEKSSKIDLSSVEYKLDALSSRMTPAKTDLSEVISKLDALLKGLDGLKVQKVATDAKPSAAEITMHNVGKMDKEKEKGKDEEKDKDKDKIREGDGEKEKAKETDETSSKKPSPAVPSTHGLDSQLSQILSILKEEQGHRESQSKQQVENLRYMNELNQWLEKFVLQGTAQIQTLSTGVDSLCKELVLPKTQQNQPNSPGASVISMLAEIKGLVAGKSEMEARQTRAMDTVVQMLERQRSEQERLLRALAADLSNDIRGERLRFIEAMKDATSVNVAQHVEDFKRELGRESTIMAKEVGRLREERQKLEHDLADMFALKAKYTAKIDRGGDERKDRDREKSTPGKKMPGSHKDLNH